MLVYRWTDSPYPLLAGFVSTSLCLKSQNSRFIQPGERIWWLQLWEPGDRGDTAGKHIAATAANSSAVTTRSTAANTTTAALILLLLIVFSIVLHMYFAVLSPPVVFQYEEIQLDRAAPPAAPPSECIYYKAQMPRPTLPQHWHLRLLRHLRHLDSSPDTCNIYCIFDLTTSGKHYRRTNQRTDCVWHCWPLSFLTDGAVVNVDNHLSFTWTEPLLSSHQTERSPSGC